MIYRRLWRKRDLGPSNGSFDKSREPIAKRVSAKPDFIGRLKGIIRIVGDIESSVVPLEEWDCCREDDLERINQAADRPNAESVDATEYQTKHVEFDAVAKKRGRGRPRHTS
jgi:hypothetical protein